MLYLSFINRKHLEGEISCKIKSNYEVPTFFMHSLYHLISAAPTVLGKFNSPNFQKKSDCSKIVASMDNNVFTVTVDGEPICKESYAINSLDAMAAWVTNSSTKLPITAHMFDSMVQDNSLGLSETDYTRLLAKTIVINGYVVEASLKDTIEKYANTTPSDEELVNRKGITFNSLFDYSVTASEDFVNQLDLNTIETNEE